MKWGTEHTKRDTGESQKNKEHTMNAKSFAISFLVVGAIAFVVGLVVTYLYGLIAHGNAVLEWESSIRLALVLGIVIPLVQQLNKKAKPV
jgi:hypothetical protein